MILEDIVRNSKYFIAFLFLILSSCSLFINETNDIRPFGLTGQKIYIAQLKESYKKTQRFNKIFSKIGSKRFKPYYHFSNKIFSVVGIYNMQNSRYVVIKNKKEKLFKFLLNDNFNNGIKMPSFIVINEIYLDAKKLIGKEVWLNDVNDEYGFHSDFVYNFERFQKVKVVDVVRFQNSDVGHPVWLKIVNKNGDRGLARYNVQDVRFGIKDNYFISDPLKPVWGKKILQNIKNNQVVLGMTDNQVQIAIGYPDKINFTSSVHGISEQWIYSDSNKNIYYQFEYGKLIHVVD